MHCEKFAIKISLLFCLMLIVSGCSNTSRTHFSDYPTNTPASSITPTLLPTRQSTPTPRPSHTSANTTTAVTVPLENEATTETQTVERRITLTSRFPILCESDIDIDHHRSLSPDGSWLAISCSANKVRNLEIVNQDGKRWLLRYEDYAAEGAGSLNPIHWLNNDYLYFTSKPHISVWGACLYYESWSQGLYRIDLETGSVSATLPPLNHPDYVIVFSPNGHRLAYNGAGNHFAILDLRTGKEDVIKVKDHFIGNLTWSPDSSTLAYATCQDNQDGSEVVKSSIKVYSLNTHVSETILEEEGELLGIDVEDANPFLKIAKDQYLNHPTYIWLYDWASGQFVNTDRTPTPAP
jgi:Tol biopolymer transport system component